MSPAVVVFGWMLVIPSLVVLVFAAFGLATWTTRVSSGEVWAADVVKSQERDIIASYSDRFEEADIPHSYLVVTAEGRELTRGQLEWLSPDQRGLISKVRFARSIDAGLAAGAEAGFVVMGLPLLLSIISGALIFLLLGWILVMKKRVLQCSNCGAVVAAS